MGIREPSNIFYTANNENKLNTNKQNCSWQTNCKEKQSISLPTDF